jgi:photosystem II stability/assembly factor-like uncharacterized protein
MRANPRQSRLRAVVSIAPVLAVLAVALADPARGAVDQWSQIGPFGGRVTDVLFHPGNDRIAFASTSTNGVFRSTDGGQSWTPANVGLPYRNADNLAISPGSPGSPVTLYASVGGLHKSTDNGVTWTPTGLDSSARVIALSPASPETLVVTTSTGIRRSDDGGATWRDLARPAGSSSAVPSSLELDPRTPDILYAGVPGHLFSPGPQGLYRSTDGGATWSRLDTGLVEEDLSFFVRYALALAPDRPDTLYASIVDSGIPRKSALARSTDAGATWTLLDGPGGFPVLALPGGRVVTDRAVSTDFGATWLSHTPPTVGVAALAAHPSRPQNVLLGAEYRGIFRSADGGASWGPSSRGMTATQIESLVVGADSTLYAGATGDGLFTSGNGGSTWERLEHPPGVPADDFSHIRTLAVHPRRPRLLYAAVSGNSKDILVRTDNGGASWTSLGPLPNGTQALDFALDPTAPASVFVSALGDFSAGPCKSFKSTDRGATWQCLRLGLVLDIEIDPVDPRNAYGAYGRVTKSTDRGVNWTPLGYNRGLPQYFGPILLVHAPGVTGHLYLVSSDGQVYRTTDGGRNWKRVTGNLPVSPAKNLAVDPRNPAVAYAAVSGMGVYRTKDGGRRWQLLNRGLSGDLLSGSSFDPPPLAVDPRDPSTIYVGTITRGVFAITLTN